MIRLFVPLCIAFVVIVAIQAEPLRRRRQSANQASVSPTPTFPLAVPVPCPVQCSVKLVRAWSKAVAFDVPTASMVDDDAILGAVGNSTLDLMCSLYSSHTRCLKGCVAASPDNAIYLAALQATPSYVDLCTDKKAELGARRLVEQQKEQFQKGHGIFDIRSSSTCLAETQTIYQSVCMHDNEELFAASVRLSQQTQLDQDALRHYCKKASLQSFCVLPLVQQTCGAIPYNAIRALINGTLTGVRVSVGEKTIKDLYPECESYLDAVVHGFPIEFINGSLFNITTPSHEVDNSTSAVGDGAATTQLVLRDDANGPDDVNGGRMGVSATPRVTTTSGACRSFKNAMVISSLSVILCTFL